MRNIKKSIIVSSLAALVVTICAFTQPGIKPQSEKPKNLKVLPKNISDEELTKTMRGFNAALGVKCGYCHSPKTNGDKGMDFANDSNPKKNIAREMMKMTNKINNKYFKFEHEGKIQNISCETCHNGKEEPKMILVSK